MYYSFWYYTRMSLPAGIMGVLELFQHYHDASVEYKISRITDEVSSTTPMICLSNC